MPRAHISRILQRSIRTETTKSSLLDIEAQVPTSGQPRLFYHDCNSPATASYTLVGLSQRCVNGSKWCWTNRMCILTTVICVNLTLLSLTLGCAAVAVYSLISDQTLLMSTLHIRNAGA